MISSSLPPFHLRLEIGDSGLFLCPFRFVFLASLGASYYSYFSSFAFITVYFLSECITLIFCWWAVYVFNASRQRTSTKCFGSVVSFSLVHLILLSLSRIMRKTHRNDDTFTNERVEKRLKKKRPEIRKTIHFDAVISYIITNISSEHGDALHLSSQFTYTCSNDAECVCVLRLLSR